MKTESGMRTKQCVYMLKNEGQVARIYSRMKAKSTPNFD